MARFLLKLRFDGTRYHGWQVQDNACSVQSTVQAALSGLTAGGARRLTGCGRTDAGVHANAYYAHFDCDRPLAPADYVRGLNAKLPGDIAALACFAVPPDFHARYSASGKQYLYRIYESPVRDPFREGYALRTPRAPDLLRLNRAAASALGEHDFSAFRASGSSVKNTVRRLTESRFARHGDELRFWVTGDGFLYNMVRILVGTLLAIGRGALPEDAVERAFRTGNRAELGVTAPPYALYLNDVFYGGTGT